MTGRPVFPVEYLQADAAEPAVAPGACRDWLGRTVCRATQAVLDVIGLARTGCPTCPRVVTA